MHRWLQLTGIALLATTTLSTAVAKQPGEQPGEQPATQSGKPGAGETEVSVTLIKVDDGDSFAAYDSTGTRHRVRLAAIDAPELRQAWGPNASRQLNNLLQGKLITLYVRKKDRYKRLVARVVVDGKNVGLTLVRAGHAWHFRRFAHEQPAGERALFSSAESNARDAGLGLWRAAKPIPPWQWRRDMRKKR